jgi:hypothetical protein
VDEELRFCVDLVVEVWCGLVDLARSFFCIEYVM